MHNNLRLGKRRLDWATGPEDLGKFFEGAAASFDVEEVDEDELEDIPEDE